MHKSNRVLALRLNDIVLINVYFPFIGHRNYEEELQICLSNIETVINSVSNMSFVIGGDINIDFSKVDSSIYDIFHSFMNEYGLCLLDELIDSDSIGYTYRVFNTNSYSFIDHFLVTKDIFKLVKSCFILDSEINFSDHCCLCTNIGLNYDMRSLKFCNNENLNKDSASINNFNYRWDKGDLYKYSLDCKLLFDCIHVPYFLCDTNSNLVYDKGMVQSVIDNYYNKIIKALSNASIASIPVHKNTFYKHWWNEELNLLKEDAHKNYKIWCEAGRPRSGSVFYNMQSSKLQYKTSINKKKLQADQHFTDELADNLSHKDMDSFWKSWRSKFKKNVVAKNIEGESDSKIIVNKFANFFKEVCIPNNEDFNEKQKIECFSFLNNNYMGDIIDFNSINESIIENSIKNMKLGKAAGRDNITVEHLLHAHSYILVLLRVLFKCCLVHGIVPSDFGLGIIIPLVKNPNDDVTKISNYRGITLSPVISKLFEMCLLNILKDKLQSSHLQFGFKKNSSCSNAIVTLRSVLNYYNSNGSTVSICALDISKAFDRVNFYVLIQQLMKRMIPVCILKLLLHWFSISQCCVRWNNVFSEFFVIRAGVRQGGILSPTLFAIYMDVLINELESSGIGCKFYDNYVGCLVYADDIILLSPSQYGMQTLLNICSNFAIKFDLKYNVKKSFAMRVGKRYKKACEYLKLDNEILQYVNEIKYLGVTIKSSTKFVVNFDIFKRKFYRSFNAIYSKSKSNNSELVSVQLMQSYCLPMIWYSIEALKPTKTVALSLDNSVNMALGKIFNTYDSNVINEIRLQLNIANTLDINKDRSIKFLKKLILNDSKLIDLYKFTAYNDHGCRIISDNHFNFYL